MQKPVGAAAPPVGAGSATGQTVLAAHATAFVGGGVAISSSHVNPFPQSAAVVHACCARAVGAAARSAIDAPTDKRSFLGDIGMGDLRS
jgi:hypothetical protein